VIEPAPDPLATVVIPAFNAALTLPAQLDALVAQTPGFEFEIVVSDNGSTDATASLARTYPKVRVIDASGRRGASAARNRGAAAAHGDYLLFCDADDVVSKEWVSLMVAALRGADLVGGPFEQDSLQLEDDDAWRHQVADRLPGSLFLPAATSGNMGVRRTAFEALHGFDQRYDRISGEDIDLSWRAQLGGYRVDFAAGAVVAVRHRADDRALARQAYRHGKGLPLLYRVHRSNGMPRRRFRRSLRQAAWVIVRLPRLFGSSAQRREWLWGAGNLVGRIAGAIEFRVLYV
jgi:glycosyltransferase involved in cell wall biosynthesis